MVKGSVKSFAKEGNRVVIEFDSAKVEISVITEDILNVFVPLYTDEHFSKAIEGEKVKNVEYSVEKEGDKVVISTSTTKVEVGNDFVINFYKADGTVLLTDYLGELKKKEDMSEKAKRLLAAEGHDISNLGDNEYAIKTVKTLDKDDCFYGLGDKTGFLNKRNYLYENWNSDIPQAHNEDYRALYKSIPFLMCLKKTGVYGLFFDNTFHSYLNLGKECNDYFYYAADGGNLDYYFMNGNSLVDIIEHYTYLTGRTPLPQLWTLGYQQSRWGYECKEDILEVANAFRKNRIPCESIHFDIDYMDNFKVFTWDEKEYDKKGKLLDKMEEMGYKTVTIIDPGTKKEDGYFMYDEGMKNGFFAKDKDGEVYINEVWPGESTYPDFGNPKVRSWWADAHKILLDMGVYGVWNDMNEPASFRGELPLDVKFTDEGREIEHAEMHNIYGHYMAKATFEGLRKHSTKRPFIITRACYAGTQKYSTVWTGDNQSLWSHLQMTIPQFCNLGMSGFTFCGADIGGFGADTTPELLTRWIEAACFTPLFRNHSAKGTRRQEPWLFGDDVMSIYRKYVELRYKFLPYIYDLFYKGEKTGLPVMRPLVLHYEKDENTHNMNGEFLVGENILVAPVVEQGADKKLVYLPEGTWFDYWTGEKHEGGKYFIQDAPIDFCPIYIKAGSIIPTYDVVQYTGEKKYDTLRLIVTPGEGEYEHFQDNGTDYAYKDGAYNLYKFKCDKEGNVTTTMVNEGYEKYSEIIIDTLGK